MVLNGKWRQRTEDAVKKPRAGGRVDIKRFKVQLVREACPPRGVRTVCLLSCCDLSCERDLAVNTVLCSRWRWRMVDLLKRVLKLQRRSSRTISLSSTSR